MSATRKILVVDDDAVVAKSFDRVLRNKGYAVITASSGEEALLKLKNERYDVVFTDIKMPGMSGIDVAEQVKKSQPWLPVVVITGYGSGDNEARAGAAGVSGFLHKPLSPEMIEGSTDKALRELDAILAAPVETKVVAEAEVQAVPLKQGNTLKNIALFFAAPFIGLAYIVAMPFVGTAVLGWMIAKALVGTSRVAAIKAKVAALLQPKLLNVLKNIGMFVAAPFIGLAYVIAMPFAGVIVLGWFCARSMLARK